MDDNDSRNWGGIEHDYVKGDWSQRRIALAHGISEKTLADHAKKHGWVREVGTTPLPRGRKPRAPGVPKAKAASADQLRRRKMVKRLLEALDLRLKQLEERMAPNADTGAGPQSAADAERDARSLSALARLYAKLVEFDDQAKKLRSGTGTRPSEREDDADQLRRDLALRLQRLHQAGDA